MKLLRKKPYKIVSTMSRYESLRVGISQKSGFEKGDRVYQVKLENGIVQLIPEKLFLSIEDYKKVLQKN